jgi:transcription-repair coupling factor (superfamily II helicase)
VDEPGEIAIRGGAIDLFPSDAEQPVRIHLSEGRVERIALYDPVSQLGCPAGSRYGCGDSLRSSDGRGTGDRSRGA